MKSIKRLSLALIIFSLFTISYLITLASAQDGLPKCIVNPEDGICYIVGSDKGQQNQGNAAAQGAPATFDDGLMGAAPGSAAAGHMNQGYQGGAPGSAAAGHMNQGNANKQCGPGWPNNPQC